MEPSKSQREEPPREVRRRILIVEDQELTATELESTLRQLGYEIAAVVSSGEEAVRQARALRPELVLTDIRLAGALDGIEAAGLIRAELDIPVVYLTGHADEATIRRATATTPFGFLVKPFNERELRASIEIAFYKHQIDRELVEARARRRVAEERQRLIEAYERALSESEQRFRTAVIRAPVPMMLHAEDGEVLAVSDSVVAATGYSRAEIRTLNDWLERAYDAQATEIRAIVEQAFAGSPPPPTELPVRIASGEVRQWLFSVSPPLMLGADRRGIVVVAVDVTKQRRAEQALLESHRQKDAFIAMLGHELRNPLAAVRTATELLKLTLNGDPRQKRVENVLERQTAHMAKLIDGLLDVSRIVSGRLSLDKETVDVRDVLHETLQDRQDQIENRGLELHTDIDTRECWVGGDRVRLAQVFDNLLANAIKFTRPPGTITLMARCQGDRAVVIVSDTGSGIAPELLPHIFEPFRQAEQSLGRVSGGLGLGLAIVKGLVELHGGTIAVASGAPGVGAEFTVTLPLAAAPERSPERVRGQPRPSRVLIVEDNVDAADTLRAVLETIGNQVEVAYDGESALTKAHDFDPEVILCDIGLPGGMSGYDLARVLRSEDAHAFLVAVTGYGRPEDIRHAHEVGFDDHLTKPIALAAIQALLARYRHDEHP